MKEIINELLALELPYNLLLIKKMSDILSERLEEIPGMNYRRNVKYLRVRVTYDIL